MDTSNDIKVHDVGNDLRMHDVARACDHKFVDTVHCIKCGWVPPGPDVVAQMLVMWERLTHDERMNFWRKATIR